MGTAVFFAVRDAVTAVRIAAGLAPDDAARFKLSSPATAARVRLAIDARVASPTAAAAVPSEFAVAQL
eukprot:SAG22_NODE_12227_length_451_cov_1.019886_1_plen_68_part_00